MSNCISESDLDVKLELKSVMDKIRTFSLGKNKEIVVGSPYVCAWQSSMVLSLLMLFLEPLMFNYKTITLIFLVTLVPDPFVAGSVFHC